MMTYPMKEILKLWVHGLFDGKWNDRIIAYIRKYWLVSSSNQISLLK